MKWFGQYLQKLIGNWKTQQEPDVYIVSYPKTGRTWLRLLLGRALCESLNIDGGYMLDTLRLTNLAGVAPTTFTHDSSSMAVGLPYNQLQFSAATYQSKKVVLLIRDLRDTLVSCYFQATKRIKVYDGTISDFVRTDRYGARKCVTFYANWYANRSVPTSFLTLRYEDMHADPAQVLRQVLDFIGITAITDSQIAEAVAYGSFENMQKLESAGHYRKQLLTPGDARDKESYKVRRGKVGGYSDYLNPDDCLYIEGVMKEARCPIFDPYLTTGSKKVA